MMDISIVIPLLDEAESLPELEAWIKRVMDENNYTYEMIFVDDGSSDNSWNVIEQLRQNNPFVRGIKFQRNYGKSAALNEGFRMANGKVVVTMDADLQDSPDEIPELRRMVLEDAIIHFQKIYLQKFIMLLQERQAEFIFMILIAD
jgi:glycosyltransferase involved in cell wall biosynthesis